jgi:peptidoglycan/LPS O-acetylase OafA/YrhL
MPLTTKMTINIPVPPHNSEHLLHAKYRADIDGLRAISILSVVGFHAFPNYVNGGFIGVDIFFVISGFLISTIIIGSLERNSFSFIEFYIRRIKRIFPALLLVLIASFAFGWFALLSDEYKQLGKHIAGGAGFISNILLWKESGYFDSVAETKPLLHLWSLGVEEQFYIIWPLLMWFAWRRRLNLLIIAIAVGVISFALNIDKVNSDQAVAFYSPQTRFWELMAGSVLAYMKLHKQNNYHHIKHRLGTWLGQIAYKQSPEENGKKLRNIESILGFVLIVIGLLFITKDRHFPGWWAVLPTLGAALIISAGSQAWLNRVVLSNRILVWFGLISFPLYLWHWPLLSFARIVESETPPIEIRIVAVLVSIALAWLTYILIEKNIRFGNHGKAKTITLIALMLFVGFVGYNSYERNGLEFRKYANPPEAVRSKLDAWHYMDNDICINRYPFKYNYGYWFCMMNKDENPTLLLVGNSYANHLYPGLANNPSFKHHTILSIGNCDAAEPDKTGLDMKPLSSCDDNDNLRQQRFVASIIEKSNSVKFAIIDGLDRDPTQEYILRVKKRIDFLEKNNIKVIVFTPHLRLLRDVLHHDIRGCFVRGFHKPKNCDADISERIKLTERFRPLIQKLSISNPNVAFFDPNDLVCNKVKCSAIRNGMPLYRDLADHLSVYGSEELSNIFEKWARTNIPQILN